MIKDITLGQFFPGNSVVHRLDPRMKIILVVIYVVLLFVINSAVGYAVIASFTFAVIAMTKIPVKLYFRGLKPLLFIVVFTALLNLFYSSGEPIVQFWIFKITLNGIKTAIFMVVRILLLVLGTSILSYTTSPIVLTGGMERLLSPLSKIKVPVQEFSMMMTIALRFIPTLLEETDKIMNAQKARGADFESGSLIQRAKALTPILIPLFVSAFRRADELAVAMECRGYTGESSVKRTYLTQYKLHFCDFASLGALTILFILMIFVFNNLKIYGF